MNQRISGALPGKWGIARHHDQNLYNVLCDRESAQYTLWYKAGGLELERAVRDRSLSVDDEQAVQAFMKGGLQ